MKVRGPHEADVVAVARSLGTDLENGLTSQEAARRLAQDGPNELLAAAPTPTWRRVLSQFQDPLVYLWGAIALSGLLQVAVVHLEILNLAFGTAPLTLDQWLVCAAMGSVVLWFSEFRKLVKRRIA